LVARGRIFRDRQRCVGRRGAQRLNLGHAAGLELGDDLVGHTDPGRRAHEGNVWTSRVCATGAAGLSRSG
jgi:hypothetical protein